MILVVSFLVKTLAAIFTYERLDALVDPHVSVESRRTVERLAACSTHVRFLGCMDDLMTAES